MISDDRIRLIEGVPPALPNCCIICNNGTNDRDYIDFGWDIPEWGAVYFCSICLRGALLLLNWIPPEDVILLEAQIKFKEKELEEAKGEAKSELYSLLRDSRIFDGFPGFYPVDPLERHYKHSETESDSSKSSSKSGPTDIHESSIPDL